MARRVSPVDGDDGSPVLAEIAKYLIHLGILIAAPRRARRAAAVGHRPRAATRRRRRARRARSRAPRARRHQQRAECFRCLCGLEQPARGLIVAEVIANWSQPRQSPGGRISPINGPWSQDRAVVLGASTLRDIEVVACRPGPWPVPVAINSMSPGGLHPSPGGSNPSPTRGAASPARPSRDRRPRWHAPRRRLHALPPRPR
jgi:hypothetical protein